MHRSSLLLLLLLAPLVVGITGCEKGKEAIKEKQEEVANEVGGAPKRTIDSVERRVNASIKKGVDRLGENSGVEVK